MMMLSNLKHDLKCFSYFQLESIIISPLGSYRSKRFFNRPTGSPAKSYCWTNGKIRSPLRTNSKRINIVHIKHWSKLLFNCYCIFDCHINPFNMSKFLLILQSLYYSSELYSDRRGSLCSFSFINIYGFKSYPIHKKFLHHKYIWIWRRRKINHYVCWYYNKNFK